MENQFQLNHGYWDYYLQDQYHHHPLGAEAVHQGAGMDGERQGEEGTHADQNADLRRVHAEVHRIERHQDHQHVHHAHAEQCMDVGGIERAG